LLRVSDGGGARASPIADGRSGAMAKKKGFSILLVVETKLANRRRNYREGIFEETALQGLEVMVSLTLGNGLLGPC